MVGPQLEPWSLDAIISLPGSSGAALFNLILVAQEDSELKFPQCQAEVAETNYQPTRVIQETQVLAEAWSFCSLKEGGGSSRGLRVPWGQHEAGLG